MNREHPGQSQRLAWRLFWLPPARGPKSDTGAFCTTRRQALQNIGLIPIRTSLNHLTITSAEITPGSRFHLSDISTTPTYPDAGYRGRYSGYAGSLFDLFGLRFA